MRIGFIANLREEDFAFAQQHGLPCVEFNTSDDPDSVATLVAHQEQVQAWCEKYQVDISHTGLYGCNHISDDPEERARHFANFKAQADFTAAVGAPLITTGGGHPSGNLAADLQKLFQYLPPYFEYAAHKGLRFAFYNCHWGNFVIGPEAWEPILEKYPQIGIKFDPSHPIYDGRDWKKQMADFGAHIVHTHAKDTIFIDGRPFEDVPAGMGDTDWGVFMALLHHHGYTGDINIEPHSRTWHGDKMYAGILIARNHLAQFLGN